MKADLHIHSRFSNDGELGIPDILRQCKESGTTLFSITDHNGIRGAREAAALCAKDGDIVFIPGIEIDCNYNGTDLHLLGYQVDVNSPDFDSLEKMVNKLFLDSTPLMLRNLARIGIEVDSTVLMQKAGGKPPTGELIAEVLLMNPGQHSNPALKPYLPGGNRSDMPLINFYLDFLAQGKPAHVEIQHMDFQKALDLVQDNGGIPFVAHPGMNFEGREEVVKELLDEGARGLEVFNNYHSAGQTARFAALTREQGSLMTCGSDFHGKNKPLISIGQYRSPEAYKAYLDQSLISILEYQKKRYTT